MQGTTLYFYNSTTDLKLVTPERVIDVSGLIKYDSDHLRIIDLVKNNLLLPKEGWSDWALVTNEGLFFLEINETNFQVQAIPEERIKFEFGDIRNISWYEHHLGQDILLLNVHELFYQETQRPLHNYVTLYNRQMR